MLNLIFSLDYEIYGSGSGAFDQLMIEPTRQLLDVFNAHGAKLTIMAEVAEILALQRHREFHDVRSKIDMQLREAISQGHDVQLHLHPAWFNAEYNEGRWNLDQGEYALVYLPKTKISDYIRRGKEYLELLGKSANPDYRCIAYRGGNWLMQPSANIIESLEAEGFLYETSVFKHGFGRVGQFTMDYRKAHSNIRPWVVDRHDVALASDREGLREIPILSRKVLVTSMLTRKRLALHRNTRRGCSDVLPSSNRANDMGSGKAIGRFSPFCAKKFDFCRLTFREMKSFISYAIKKTQSFEEDTPVVAIGHSTESTDTECLKRLLDYVGQQDQVQWATFFDLYQNQILASKRKPI